MNDAKKFEVKMAADIPIEGKYICAFRNSCMTIVQVVRSYQKIVPKGTQDRITYKILSGADKGKEVDSLYVFGDTITFDTEEECRKHFDVRD
jgi:hypothetical protein